MSEAAPTRAPQKGVPGRVLFARASSRRFLEQCLVSALPFSLPGFA
jgi:hypothetical protein